MNDLFEAIAAQPIFWVVGAIAAIFCVAALFVGDVS